MEDRKLKWYLNKKASEKGITANEYYNNYYLKYNKKFNTKEEYYKDYYSRNKEKWYTDKGRYIYFIYILDNKDIYYIGSTENLRSRLNRHRSKEKIKELIDNGYKYGVFYLKVDDECTREELYDLEYYFIKKYSPKANEEVPNYDENVVKKYLSHDFKKLDM